MRSHTYGRRAETIVTASRLPAHVAWGRQTNVDALILFSIFVAAVEYISISASAYVANIIYHVSIGVDVKDIDQTKYFVSALAIAAIVLFCSVVLHPVIAIQTQRLDKVLANGSGAVCVGFSLFVSAMFFLKITDQYSRGAFIFQLVAVTAVMLGERAILFSGVRSAIASGVAQPRRVILIGDAARCAEAGERMKGCGIRVERTFPIPAQCDFNATSSDGRGIRSLIESCRALKAQEILVLSGPSNWPMIEELVNPLSLLPVGLHLVPLDCEAMFSKSRIVEFGNIVTVQMARPPLSALDQFLKRTFDVCASISGLILLAPLFAILSLAIKLDSRGPVFFRQLRHGYNGETISVIKFRSMIVLENDSGWINQAQRNDPRVTRVGRVLRRTSLDELPQLLNVLLGEMSIVGPRPHAAAHDMLFETLIQPYARRHTVKPGITGWAQVNGFRGETDTIDKMRRRIDYDLDYIDNWSHWFDLKIIFLTLFSKQAHTGAY